MKMRWRRAILSLSALTALTVSGCVTGTQQGATRPSLAGELARPESGRGAAPTPSAKASPSMTTSAAGPHEPAITKAMLVGRWRIDWDTVAAQRAREGRNGTAPTREDVDEARWFLQGSLAERALELRADHTVRLINTRLGTRRGAWRLEGRRVIVTLVAPAQVLDMEVIDGALVGPVPFEQRTLPIVHRRSDMQKSPEPAAVVGEWATDEPARQREARQTAERLMNVYVRRGTMTAEQIQGNGGLPQMTESIADLMGTMSLKFEADGAVTLRWTGETTRTIRGSWSIDGDVVIVTPAAMSEPTRTDIPVFWRDGAPVVWWEFSGGNQPLEYRFVRRGQ